MASTPKRAKLIAEITELKRLQIESIASATFVGWTTAQVAAHDKRRRTSRTPNLRIGRAER
jgi:hypothetical protein